MVSESHYSLVRTNTTKVKIDDQCDILAVGSDSMVETGRGWCLQLSHNTHVWSDPEPPPCLNLTGCLLLFERGDFPPSSGTNHVFGPLILRPPPPVERETWIRMCQDTGSPPPFRNVRRLAGVGSEYLLPNLAMWPNPGDLYRLKVSKPERAKFCSSSPLYGTCHGQPTGYRQRSFPISFKTCLRMPATR